MTSVLIRAQARSDSGRGDVPVLRTWFASSTLFYRRTGPNGPEDRVGGAIKARQPDRMAYRRIFRTCLRGRVEARPAPRLKA